MRKEMCIRHTSCLCIIYYIILLIRKILREDSVCLNNILIILNNTIYSFFKEKGVPLCCEKKKIPFLIFIGVSILLYKKETLLSKYRKNINFRMNSS
jgi:hypothetical protein